MKNARRPLSVPFSLAVLLVIASILSACAGLPSAPSAAGGAPASSNPVVGQSRPAAPAVPMAAGSGGNAVTTSSGTVHGLAKGSPNKPVIDQALMDKVNGHENEKESGKDPQTPLDPKGSGGSGKPLNPEAQAPRNAGSLSPTASGAAPAPNASPYDFTYFELKDQGAGTGSIIPEPSTASSGPMVLETWNWYAGISADYGSTWTYYNPATLFPSAYGGFCCDQVAFYDPAHDTTIWILQYVTDANNNNAIRLAWAVGKNNLANAAFCYTDFTPQQLGSLTGTNFDQPKFSRSANDDYLEMTQYGAASGSVVLRFAASELTTSCGGVNYQWYSPGLFSPGFSTGAGATMYFAAHVSTSTLRVFAWPESAANWTGITSHDVSHTAYPANFPYSCPRTGGSSTSDWCQRYSYGGGYAHSDRIFNGWVTAGVISFAWDASQGTNGLQGGYNFPYPFIDVVRVNEGTFGLFGEYVFWNPSFAIQYSSTALNDRGQMGGTVMWGGGSYYENCAAFLWDANSPGWGGPASYQMNDWYSATASNADPSDVMSGDYMGARRNGFIGTTFSATCYALSGGGQNGNIHPYYLWFGRLIDRLIVPLYLPAVLR